MGQPAKWDQDSFKGFEDDAVEGSATQKAATNSNWSQAVDENFRVRFLVQNYGGSNASLAMQLQYNLGGAGWNDVTGASSVVRSFASDYVTDGASTSQQIGAGTFDAGEFEESDGLTGSITINAGEETEVEYVLQIRSADVSNGNTVALQLVDGGGSGLDSYTNSPSITVIEAASYTITGDVSVNNAVASGMDYTLNASITGNVAVNADPTASSLIFGHNYSVSGSVSVPTTISATTAYQLNASIAGDVTVPTTVSATTAYQLNASIAGDIAVPTAISSDFDYTLNASLTGDIIVPTTIAAGLNYNLNASVSGDITVQETIAAGFDYDLNASITGSVSVPSTISAGMIYGTSGAEITGSVQIPISIAAALAYNLNASIDGSVPLPIAVASGFDYDLNASISGAVTVQATVGSAFDYDLNASITGSIVLPVSASSTMLYQAPSGDSISGDIPLSLSIAGVVAFTAGPIIGTAAAVVSGSSASGIRSTARAHSSIGGSIAHTREQAYGIL